MVFAVTGKLGGGKSLTCVRLMIDHLLKGDFVTSNILLKEDFLRKNRINASRYTYIDDFSTVDPWTLRAGSLRGSGGKCRSMIVVDEAGEWLDSYSDARHKGQLSDIASWLRQSDKLGQDVYFIVQFENLLHNRLRSIVHFWIVCKDLSKIRIPLLPFSLPIINKFVIATYFDGRNKDMSKRLWILKNSYLFSAYDTASFFGDSFKRSLSSETLALTGQNFNEDLTVEKLLFFLSLISAGFAIFMIFVFFRVKIAT